MTAAPASPIFTPEFLRLDPAQVVQSITDTGYFSFERAVRPEFLQRLQLELAPHRPAFNLNDAAPVWFNEQYFFPHALACSRSYFDYVTADALRAVCESKFGDGFRLKCHRYYETGPGHSMEWHADNVTNEGVVTDSNGLIFILYVNDVQDGEFQLVSDTYKARQSGEWSYNYTNEYIEQRFGDKVRSFRMPAGSLVVYDTYGIHRARPIVSRSFVRKSIFFQVDQSDRFAEKLLLNPAFFERRDAALLDYLGFGKPHDYPANPRSSMNDVPAGQLLRHQGRLLAAFAWRFKYGLFTLLPHDTRIRYKRWKAATAASLKQDYPRLFRLLKRTLGRIV
jgi:hypothetical protein